MKRRPPKQNRARLHPKVLAAIREVRNGPSPRLQNRGGYVRGDAKRFAFDDVIAEFSCLDGSDPDEVDTEHCCDLVLRDLCQTYCIERDSYAESADLRALVAAMAEAATKLQAELSGRSYSAPLRIVRRRLEDDVPLGDFDNSLARLSAALVEMTTELGPLNAGRKVQDDVGNAFIEALIPVYRALTLRHGIQRVPPVIRSDNPNERADKKGDPSNLRRSHYASFVLAVQEAVLGAARAWADANGQSRSIVHRYKLRNISAGVQAAEKADRERWRTR